MTPSRAAFARWWRRLTTLGVNLLLVVTIGFAVVVMLPSLLGFERYVITGGSMSGTIEKGSVVFEERVPVEDLKVDDVITYLPPAESGVDTLVTHRIISIDTDEAGRRELVTQGDANPDPDPWRFSLVDSEQPVVTHTVPWVGHVLLALADPGTRRLVIGVPAGVIALLALRELVGALRARRNPAPECGTPVEQALPSCGIDSETMDEPATATPQPALADTHAR